MVLACPVYAPVNSRRFGKSRLKEKDRRTEIKRLFIEKMKAKKEEQSLDGSGCHAAHFHASQYLYHFIKPCRRQSAEEHM